ncbi:hypothetical protein WDW86_01635 [Bdellovibrionota bacterium FG-2]
MTFWIIVSWVSVLVLTGVNIFVFWKLKSASEQMLKMAFPGAKNMQDALSKMQGMMGKVPGGLQGMGGALGGAASNVSKEAQLRAAMQMLQKKRRR